MGRKRLRSNSGSRSKKCEKADVDRISQLPDDILVAILSFLSLKEAACTSVLSSRWVQLWKHSPCLNFDVWSSLKKVAQNRETFSQRRSKYVKWVNGIIRSHRALNLKEFSIRFRLTKSANKVIARWLEFAFVRHVQMLELDMSEENQYTYLRQGTYCVFPEAFLTLSSGGPSTSKRHSNSSYVDFKCLKVLSMKRVNVTGETIGYILSNCSSLEKLVVDDTFKLLNVEVSGASLVLKHLDLVRCHNLKSIKVSAPKLTSLTLLRLERVQEFLLENVPVLVEVSADCRCSTASNLVPALSCCISQLEVLILKLTNYQQGIVLSTFYELPKLKKLVVEYSPHGEKSFMGLTSLIRASPYLHEFVLKIIGWRRGLYGEVKDNVKFPHHHLKVLEFYGYAGHAEDLELLGYILENCVMLDKITMDTAYFAYQCPYELYQEAGPEAYRQAVKDLMKQKLDALIPERIELVIP